MSNTNENSKSEKSNTLITVLISLFISLATSFFTSKFTLHNEIEINKQDFKQSSLKEIITNEKIDDARKKIYFLLDSKLIDDDSSKIRNALNDFKLEAESTESLLQGQVIIDKAFEKRKQNKITYNQFFEESIQAIVKFTKAIDLEPKNHVALKNRGFVYQKLAFEAIRRNDVDAGNFFFEKSVDDLTAAMNYFKKPNYLYLRGISLMNLKNFDNAIQDFQKALEDDLYDDSSELLCYLGISYFYEKNIIESKKYFEKCIPLSIKQGTKNIILNDIISTLKNDEAGQLCDIISLVRKYYGNKLVAHKC